MVERRSSRARDQESVSIGCRGNGVGREGSDGSSDVVEVGLSSREAREGSSVVDSVLEVLGSSEDSSDVGSSIVGGSWTSSVVDGSIGEDSVLSDGEVVEGLGIGVESLESNGESRDIESLGNGESSLDVSSVAGERIKGQDVEGFPVPDEGGWCSWQMALFPVQLCSNRTSHTPKLAPQGFSGP